MFPAASTARARRSCPPCASPVYVCGFVQAANAPPSRLHWNVPGSFDEKLKVALVELLGFAGPAVIVVSGAPRAIVPVWVAGVVSVFPAGSGARTLELWLCPASPL